MTRFKTKTSGNPKGRPKGIPDRRSALRDVLAAELPAIVKTLIAAARDGDVAAASLILSRCMPAVRPTRELVAVPGLKMDSTATELATALVAAATRGELPIDAAVELVAALAAVAKLRESDEFGARLTALEANHNGDQ